MSDPSPPCDSIPPFLLPGNLAKRPLGVWYTQLVNLMHDESPPYTAFKLATIFHWERFKKFKHKGLTLVFERDPHSAVYLRIDFMLFENDPWHTSKGSSDSLVPKSFGGSPQAAKDQQGAEHKGRAADRCQPLDGDAIKNRPSIVDVILAAYAVSMQRRKYHLWTVNYWWLAQSIRLFIRTQWGGEDDGEMPKGLLVDMRERDLVAD
ncbi:hypothetical protein BS47DRAFT_1366102 [Hydnum rufescens UP504]|uniref:Uncharacterized protein n=1 Tax=Hydnum rufescens UP504 TaxID=1448309 RepID=A0A9P6DS29_9AGAM|nr:hypothetical protein BS47DRAFT_1366102 [Hydnum rufescens UP504]